MASPSRSAWSTIQSLPTPYSDIEDYNSDTDIEDDGTDISLSSSLTSISRLWDPAQHLVTSPSSNIPSSPKNSKVSTSLYSINGFNPRRNGARTANSDVYTTPIANLKIPPNHSDPNSFGNDQTPTPSLKKCACNPDTEAILLRLDAIETQAKWSQHTILNTASGLDHLQRIVDTLDVNIDAQKDSFLALNARLGDLHTLLKEVRNRGQVQEEFFVSIEQIMISVLDRTLETRDLAWGYGELGVHERKVIEEGVEYAGKRIEEGGAAILDLQTQLFHGLWEIVEGFEKVDSRIREVMATNQTGEPAMNEQVESVTEKVEGDETRGRQMKRESNWKRNDGSGINNQVLARRLGTRLDDNLRMMEVLLSMLRVENIAQLNRVPPNVYPGPGSEDEDMIIEDTTFTTEEFDPGFDLEGRAACTHTLDELIGGFKHIPKDLGHLGGKADEANLMNTWEPTICDGLRSAERPTKQTKLDRRTSSPHKLPAPELSNASCILVRNQTLATGSVYQPTCNYDLEINYDLFRENRHLRLENEVLKAKAERAADCIAQSQNAVWYEEKVQGETDWYEQALWPQGDPEEVLDRDAQTVFCALM